MDEHNKHQVILLLSQGWTDLVTIQEHVGISDEEMSKIIDWLYEEEYIITHTVH